jgi:hypothetical protein
MISQSLRGDLSEITVGVYKKRTTFGIEDGRQAIDRVVLVELFAIF